MTSLLKAIGAISFAAALFTTPVSAQDSHDHAGHDHNHSHDHSAAAANIPDDLDYVFTESPEDHTLGAEDAPVTMIVYASVMCPHCADWFTNDWPELKTNYIETGDVRFVFREIPTAPASAAMAGFMLANCAPEDDFMTHIEFQMENQAKIKTQRSLGTAQSIYEEMELLAGIDTPEKLQACIDDESLYERVQLSSDRSRAGQIPSVPGFIINGELYKGPSDYETLAALIDGEIDRKTDTSGE